DLIRRTACHGTTLYEVVMNNHHPNGSSRQRQVERQVGELLDQSQSFRHLDATTQQALKNSLATITGYLAESQGGAPPALAGQLAPPDLQRRLSPQSSPQAGRAQPSPAIGPPGPGAPPANAPAGSSQSATGRVGEVARATLNAIDFPSF